MRNKILEFKWKFRSAEEEGDWDVYWVINRYWVVVSFYIYFNVV